MRWYSKIQWNLSKSNLLRTNFCVWNKRVFGLYRFHYQRFPVLFGLCRILVYSGFDLDRFHCATKLCPQEATPIVRSFFQNRREGLIRGGLMYFLRLWFLFKWCSLIGFIYFLLFNFLHIQLWIRDGSFPLTNRFPLLFFLAKIWKWKMSNLV